MTTPLKSESLEEGVKGSTQSPGTYEHEKNLYISVTDTTWISDISGRDDS